MLKALLWNFSPLRNVVACITTFSGKLVKKSQKSSSHLKVFHKPREENEVQIIDFEYEFVLRAARETRSGIIFLRMKHYACTAIVGQFRIVCELH